MLITILILLLVNTAGFLLRLYDLDPYFILLGFRFHLSFFIPVLFLFNKKLRQTAVSPIKHPGRFSVMPFILVFLSAVLVFSVFYFKDYIKIADPDYFYELGLSSLIDLPVYLIWNLPQFIILAAFIYSISAGKKAGYLSAFIVLILLFAFQLIPLGKEKFSLLNAAYLGSSAVLFALMFINIKNIYIAAGTVFFSIWIFILLSGSPSEMMVRIFLGNQYENWEGFITVNKEWKEYFYLIYAGIQLILILGYILINAYNNRAAKKTVS